MVELEKRNTCSGEINRYANKLIDIFVDIDEAKVKLNKL